MSALEKQVDGSHYTKRKIQPFQFTMQNDWDALAHTILKYITRHPDKGGRKDVEKAIHCVELRKQLYKTHNRPVLAWFDRITMPDYITKNQIEGYSARALLELSAWVYDERDASAENLLTYLFMMLDEYPA